MGFMEGSACVRVFLYLYGGGLGWAIYLVLGILVLQFRLGNHLHNPYNT